MTMDDVVTKTGVSFLVTVLAAAAVWAMPGDAAWGLALPAVLVAFVLGLVISFKQIANPAATLAYAALMGAGLGAISEAFNTFYPGIVMQAVIGTFGVFAGMLVVYKTGAIRVTPKLTRWIVGAMIGVLVLIVVNLVASFITPGGLGLRDGGPVAIIFSLVVIGVAAFRRCSTSTWPTRRSVAAPRRSSPGSSRSACSSRSSGCTWRSCGCSATSASS